VVPEMLARAGDPDSPDGSPRNRPARAGYRLSEVQAQAILDLRLHRLTGLEQDKILAEYGELLELIRDLCDILARPERLLAVIRTELLEIRDQYGDARRTRIEHDESDLTIEDLITPQDVVVTLSHGGYAKAQPVSEYSAQGRGGRGKSATAVKDEDFIDKLFVVNTHDTLLCFSNRGQLYWLKVYRLPQAGRGSWQAHREPAAARRGRAHHGSIAHPRIRGGSLRVHGHRQWHGEKDAPDVLLATAPGGNHRGWSRRGRQARRRGYHRRFARRDALHLGRQGDSFPRGRRAPHGSHGRRRGIRFRSTKR
jgi:hypothetical protein